MQKFKGLRFVLVFVLCAISVLTLCVNVGAASNKGYKVYPYEPFVLGGKLNMTPNGGYEFSPNANGQLTFSMAASNLKDKKYDSLGFLYLYGVKSNARFEVKASFGDSLDGYTYADTIVYNSTATVSEDVIKIDYKTILNEAGKWSSTGKYLYLMIFVDGTGLTNAKLEIDSIWLGGSTIDTQEDRSVLYTTIDMTTPDLQGNASLVKVEDSFGGKIKFKPTTLQQEAYILKVIPEMTKENTYLYFNMSNVNANTWPMLYIRDTDTFLMGNGSNIRLRPEVGESNIWIRINVAELADNVGEEDFSLRAHISMITNAGAGADGAQLGIYIGGETFMTELDKADESSKPEESKKPTESDNSDGTPATGDNITQNTVIISITILISIVLFRRKIKSTI